MTAEERVTYRSVLCNREFLAILVAQTLSVAGDQLARIAIALLIYERTGSAFGASATYAVSYLTYLLGGPFLSAISDRNPRVTVMVVCDLLRVPLVLLLCVDDVPLWLVFAVLAAVGVLAPPFDSARSAVQPDILDGEQYVVGNALMTIIVQVAQVAGFVVGGALVAATSVKGALGLDAASFLVSAGVVLAVLRARPAAQSETSTILRDTVAGLRVVAGHPQLRRLLAYALLGSAAIIGPEGMAVPIADHLGKGATAAGILTGSVPAGFLLGTIFILRLPSEDRLRLLPRLALLGTAPLLVTPFVDSLPLLAGVWFVAGIGGSVNLIASSAYMQTCPREFRSRAYGVAITSLNAVQGGVLLLVGVLADPLGERQSVAAVALVTLGVLAVVTLRGDGEVMAQGNRGLVRSNQG